MNVRQFLLQGINLGRQLDQVKQANCTAALDCLDKPSFRCWMGMNLLAPGVCFAGLIVASALMIWKSLILITGSESPVRILSPARLVPIINHLSSQ